MIRILSIALAPYVELIMLLFVSLVLVLGAVSTLDDKFLKGSQCCFVIYLPVLTVVINHHSTIAAILS